MFYLKVQRDMKLFVDVQELLFKAGFTWKMGQSEVWIPRNPVGYIYFYTEEKQITYSEPGYKPREGTPTSLRDFVVTYGSSEYIDSLLVDLEEVTDETKQDTLSTPSTQENQKDTKKKTKRPLSLPEGFTRVYSPRSSNVMLRNVREFYKSKGVGTADRLYTKINEYYENKRAYMSPLFGKSTTIKMDVDEDLMKYDAFRNSRLGKRAIMQLAEKGIFPSPEEIINNRIKVGKQEVKLTKWLLHNYKSEWNQNTLGELYNGLQLSDIQLSISPYEFQTASENCGWSSCFRVHGEYHCSVWAYYSAKESMILKIKNSKGTTVFRLFILMDFDTGMIFFGRTYGEIDSSIYRQIRAKLEKFMADYKGFENKWVVVRDYRPKDFIWDSETMYLDDYSYIAYPKHLREAGSDYPHIKFDTGLQAEGEYSDCGEFPRG